MGPIAKILSVLRLSVALPSFSTEFLSIDCPVQSLHKHKGPRMSQRSESGLTETKTTSQKQQNGGAVDSNVASQQGGSSPSKSLWDVFMFCLRSL